MRLLAYHSFNCFQRCVEIPYQLPNSLYSLWVSNISITLLSFSEIWRQREVINMISLPFLIRSSCVQSNWFLDIIIVNVMYQRIAASFKDITLVIGIRDDEDGPGRGALRLVGRTLRKTQRWASHPAVAGWRQQHRGHRQSLPQDHSSHLGAPHPSSPPGWAPPGRKPTRL